MSLFAADRGPSAARNLKAMTPAARLGVCCARGAIRTHSRARRQAAGARRFICGSSASRARRGRQHPARAARFPRRTRTARSPRLAQHLDAAIECSEPGCCGRSVRWEVDGEPRRLSLRYPLVNRQLAQLRLETVSATSITGGGSERVCDALSIMCGSEVGGSWVCWVPRIYICAPNSLSLIWPQRHQRRDRPRRGDVRSPCGL